MFFYRIHRHFFICSGVATTTGETIRSNSLFALLGLDLPQVELELLSLKDVPVGPAALSGAGGDGGQDATGHELVLKSLLDLRSGEKQKYTY